MAKTAAMKRDSNGELISVPATMNYQTEEGTQHTLVANGKLYTKRLGDGNDDEWVGVKQVPKEVTVNNARRINGTLDDHGFTLADAPTALKREGFDDIYTILKDYYSECAELVKKVTGASFVAAFDHNVRSVKNAGTHIKDGAAKLKPVTLVHGDYTLNGSPLRLQQLTQPPGNNDEFRKVLGRTPLLPADAVERAKRGRFSIVNVWRSLMPCPLEKHPLAVCDAKTVRPTDLCVFEIHYKDRIGENYFVMNAKEHRWYYYPHMTNSEALLFKQWDTEGTLLGGNSATMCLHTAFDDTTASKDAPDRESIEVRTICIFDEKDATQPSKKLKV
mmetsp:Transcript_34243/g.63098  ORF Transcript_34243/g.63098 Transcript_34243/m.63098 type:complete len:332 (-) Transcript_34243:76-1071(-)